jgi:hypothetical protein
MAYKVPPIHTDWAAILAPEMIQDTSAALAARDAATAPFEQTARMQQPVFSRLRDGEETANIQAFWDVKPCRLVVTITAIRTLSLTWTSWSEV